MFDGNGWWVIFPIIGLIFMVLMMSRMFGFRRRGSGSRRGMDPMGMGGIVISYRREDTEGYAGRIYDRLAGRFGDGCAASRWLSK